MPPAAAPLPIFVINLERDTARWESARAQLAAQGLAGERVPAVEGARLGAAELARLYSPELNARRFFRPLTPAEIGCYASHLQCARLIRERGLRAAVILEDDFVAGPHLPALLAALAALPRPFDMVKLYSNLTRRAPLQPLAGGYELCRFRRMPINALAYVLSAAGAEKFVRAVPAGRPVDVDFKHWWELGLDILGVAPNAFTVAPGLASSIGDRVGLHRPLPVKLRRFRYKLGYALALLRHGVGPA